MRVPSGRMIVAIVAVAWTSAACSNPAANLIVVDDSGETTLAPVVATEYDISPRILRRFALLEHDSQHRQPALVNLGRMLYYETRLSKTGDVSCNTCHALDSYGVDGKVMSIGVGGQRGRRNAPSTYNAAGQFRQ
ncbi:MAG: cytochrome-c peroxidase, partial [Vicinamibacterales bacterium]